MSTRAWKFETVEFVNSNGSIKSSKSAKRQKHTSINDIQLTMNSFKINTESSLTTVEQQPLRGTSFHCCQQRAATEESTDRSNQNISDNTSVYEKMFIELCGKEQLDKIEKRRKMRSSKPRQQRLSIPISEIID